MNKLIDFKSPEKEILLTIFKELPMMDIWIASIIESYIYSWKEERYENGSLMCRYLTRFEKLEGEYKEWYGGTDQQGCNGQIWVQTTYKDDKREGEYKQWWSNGQLELQTTYKNGNENGECKIWDESGNLIINNFYINGTLKN